MDAEQRIAELEAKLTLAEDLLESLNLAVFRQQERLDALQRQIQHVASQVEASSPAVHRHIEDEVPPHY